MNSHPQLPLGLALRDSARFNSFYPGQNLETVHGLQLSAAGKGEALVYVAGSAGMGKTHLLQAACYEAVRCGRTTCYLPLQELLEFTASVFDDLEQLDLVCIDDVTTIAGHEGWEHGLFTLFNRVRESGGTLLVAGERRPDRAGFRLRDLVSRLGWGVIYVLKPLADHEVIAALGCRARARGLQLPQETAQYLLRRFPRDLPTQVALFDTLDTASLIEQRRLTVPFVKSVLDNKLTGR
ncbi:MAG: DnaA regulatory inactivator Hda [Gammaproteobacteria bacterium]|jgi:DnaA family protein|nr:DnaA regulatory inactivator Hda [Gammaproteobacteria bacterium]